MPGAPFLEGIASQFPLPSWFLTWVLLVLAVYYFSCILIKCIRFFDKTNRVCNSYDGIDGKLDSMERKHGTLIEKFNTLIATLAEKQALEHPDVFTINSPINLNQRGRDLVKDLGWEASLNTDANKVFLFNILDKMNLKTKYDVEKYSLVLLTELAGMRTENPYTPVKRYLYEHAEINDFKALTACAILLRDAYLGAHPEITE